MSMYLLEIVHDEFKLRAVLIILILFDIKLFIFNIVILKTLYIHLDIFCGCLKLFLKNIAYNVYFFKFYLL